MNGVVKYPKGKLLPLNKVVTLFFSVYIFLYMFPNPLEEIPGLAGAIENISKIADVFHIWIGRHILLIHNLQKPEPNGSGDTTFEYVKIASYIVCALFITGAACLISLRRRLPISKFCDLVAVYARYYVGVYLIVYGIAKLNHGQFPFPSLYNLDESYGDSSPMALLWRFMGYSRSYTIFSGIGEITGGLLLLFRRTTILGTLTTLGLTLNVAVLNFSYDVPVKLFSSHLVLIDLFILAPWIRSLFQFFVSQKVTAIQYPRLHFHSRWVRAARISGKILLISLLPIGIAKSLASDKVTNDTTLGLHGVYDIIKFKCSHDHPEKEIDNLHRVKKIIVDEGYGRVTTTTDSFYYCDVLVDTVKHGICLRSFDDTAVRYSFSYENTEKLQMEWFGVHNGDSVRITLARKTPENYILVNRAFHWISENPYNW
jgi:uncharacterized membrane protein YphA (DoxX/SURF4 family)